MKKRILLVERETFTADYLEQILNSVGYAVSRVPDEFAAWNFLSDVEPRADLVLCDMSLSAKSSGSDLLRTLIAVEPKRRLPFVLFGAGHDYELLECAARLGADDYLFKPIAPARLLRTVDRLLHFRERDTPTALRLLSVSETGFLAALSLPAFAGAGAQIYNLILKDLRVLPPRLHFTEAEHDPMDASAYLLRGTFRGPAHEARDLSRAWNIRRRHEHGA